MNLTEETVELAALDWLAGLGYALVHGPDIAPAERASYGDVVLVERLRVALARLNPAVPPVVLDEALRKVLRPDSPSLLVNNRVFHRMLVEGVNVEMRRSDGSIAGVQVRLVDFARIEANDWLAVNQFTVIEGQYNRRADIVLFVNGYGIAYFVVYSSMKSSTKIVAFKLLTTMRICALVVPAGGVKLTAA